MRTFVYSDATSHKFWNIELRGKSFTVTFGRVGTVGQTQGKDFADEAKAQKEHDKLIREKTGKGYIETTPSVGEARPASLREALEKALVEAPEDLASHMAYADHLGEEGDPRGEFIRVQLALEDARLSAAEREKLQEREKKLVKDHRKAWLGDLAPFFLGRKEYGEAKVRFTFRRGWLDELKVEDLTVELARALGRAPQLRLLRALTITGITLEVDGDWKPGPDVPEGAPWPGLLPLCRAEHFGNLRYFLLGEEVKDDEAFTGGFSSQVGGEAAVGIVRRLPRLEELHLLASDVNTGQLFALAMPHLRVLRVYHANRYPLEKLAKNASLTNLERIALHPHALDEDRAAIRLPGVKALLASPHLTALEHLQLRVSDMGDRGVKEIIDSGILKRLTVLDLRHGCITDKGATLLAEAPDLKHLERLELVRNNIGAEGVKALKATGVKVDLRNQWDDPDEGEFGGYLYDGDIE